MEESVDLEKWSGEWMCELAPNSGTNYNPVCWMLLPVSCCFATSWLFFNRGDTEGTNFLKILCLMFVYVLFYVNLCHDWFCVYG